MGSNLRLPFILCKGFLWLRLAIPKHPEKILSFDSIIYCIKVAYEYFATKPLAEIPPHSYDDEKRDPHDPLAHRLPSLLSLRLEPHVALLDPRPHVDCSTLCFL